MRYVGSGVVGSARGLEEAVGSKAYEGSDTERRAQQGPGKDVTEEMHTKNDARNADADGKKIKRRLEGRIEITDHQRDGECGHGVTGREGELVRGKNLRPAMRFELARTLAMTDTLQRLEQENSDDGRGTGSTDGRVTVDAATQQQHGRQAIPDPAVPHARGGQHPEANPARGFPPVHATHHAVVAILDVSP